MLTHLLSFICLYRCFIFGCLFLFIGNCCCCCGRIGLGLGWFGTFGRNFGVNGDGKLKIWKGEGKPIFDLLWYLAIASLLFAFL